MRGRSGCESVSERPHYIRRTGKQRDGWRTEQFTQVALAAHHLCFCFSYGELRQVCVCPAVRTKFDSLPPNTESDPRSSARASLDLVLRPRY